MGKETMPQLLIIAGTGRNSGKTTLACQIIGKFSAVQSIVAIKITPHFHENPGSGEVIVNKPNIYIAEERDASTGKDSSLMLKAGAVQSYFVMTNDKYLEEAFHEIFTRIPAKSVIVCESGGLRHLIRPGLFFMMQHPGNSGLKPDTAKLLSLADHVVTFDGSKFNFDINSIEIADNQWKINLNKDDTVRRSISDFKNILV